MIKFDQPIYLGKLIKRYKRFFMDIKLDSGEEVVAHTPNTGSMLGLLNSGNKIILTHNNDPKRKTRYTTQAIQIDNSWVGINTHNPNNLISQSLKHTCLDFLSSYKSFSREIKFGQQNRSRVDFVFKNHENKQPDLYLEIKNVTLKNNSQAQFPDSVSLRAQKHIRDLISTQNLGYKAGICFVIQRTDCESFAPAAHIDPEYANLLKQARDLGILIKALSAQVSKTGIVFHKKLSCEF